MNLGAVLFRFILLVTLIGTLFACRQEAEPDLPEVVLSSSTSTSEPTQPPPTATIAAASPTSTFVPTETPTPEPQEKSSFSVLDYSEENPITDSNLFALDHLVTAAQLNVITEEAEIIEWELQDEIEWKNRLCRTFLGVSWSINPNIAINCIFRREEGVTLDESADWLFDNEILYPTAISLETTLDYDSGVLFYGSAGEYHALFDLFVFGKETAYWASLSLGIPGGYALEDFIIDAAPYVEPLLKDILMVNMGEYVPTAKVESIPSTQNSKHEGYVWSVSFSPDSHWLASGSMDHTIRLWDLVASETESRVLQHESGVKAVAFSPDGRWLVSGGNWAEDDEGNSYYGIWLWDMNGTDAEPQILYGHEDTIQSVTFSPDGRRLASGSSDMTIRLWDMSDTQAEPQVLHHGDGVYAIAFSPDGRWLTSGGGWHGGNSDYGVRLWDMNDLGAEPLTLGIHTDGVTSLAFSPDGHWLASGSRDYTIRLWDLVNTGAEPAVLKGIDSWVRSVAFSPDGRWLASGSDDQAIRLWDLSDLELVPRVLQDHEDFVLSVAFSPDGRWLASGSADETVRLWDMDDLDAPSRILGIQ